MSQAATALVAEAGPGVLAGALHILRLRDSFASWKYLVYFAPYRRDLDEPPERACAGTAELEGVLSGLGLDEFARRRVLSDVPRSVVRTIPNIRTTNERLRELGF